MNEAIDISKLEVSNKKPAAFFTVANEAYFSYAISFWNSLTKFHNPKDVDMFFYTDVTDKKQLEKIPKGIRIKDLKPFLQDPNFFYRQKPVVSEPLLDEYDLVVGFDTDQIILGSLDYILETKDYDVGTIINWNRVDPQQYGFVELGRIGIAPVEYFNCGLVAIRNKKFAHHWKMICYSPQFDRVQFREQDILNVLCYYGNYNVRCFDHGDGVANNYCWYGLIGKGEWNRSILRDGDIVVQKGAGDTPFPPQDIKIKAAQLGGGHGAIKDNWGAYFPAEVMERITQLIK